MTDSGKPKFQIRKLELVAYQNGWPNFSLNQVLLNVEASVLDEEEHTQPTVLVEIVKGDVAS